MEIKLTNEQKEIVRTDLRRGEVLIIQAFAGTGKTTTLVEFAKARPDKKLLYVAFNRSAKEDAERRFPKNVVCKTVHGLAWPKFGSRHAKRLVTSLKPNQVKKALGLSELRQAFWTISTLNNFLASDDNKVEQKHVPQEAVVSGAAADLIDCANRLGRLVCTGDSPLIGMLHDCYLKLYQLSRPVLDGYDYILVDEAQDLTPAQLSILLGGNRTGGTVIVGDSHQAIYGFRGAVEAMGKIKADHRLYLTESFRLTQSTAFVANLLLSVFCNEQKKIKGKRLKKITDDGRKTIICRSNAEVFRSAVKYCRTDSLAFIGGIDGYRFDKIMDAYWLYSGRRTNVRDAFLSTFDCFEALSSYSKVAEDIEIMGLVYLVKEYKSSTGYLIDKIKKATVKNPEKASVVITTAHKAKGLEFPRVLLTDDYTELVETSGRVKRKVSQEELNLLYVACTRAMDKLCVMSQSDLARFLSICKQSGRKNFNAIKR